MTWFLNQATADNWDSWKKCPLEPSARYAEILNFCKKRGHENENQTLLYMLYNIIFWKNHWPKCFGISTLPIASFRTMLSSLPPWIKKYWRSYPGLQIPRHVHVTFLVEENEKLVFILIFITLSEAYLRAKTTFKIWHFYSATNFNSNCLETACINTLQFLFQIFTLFNPISNILGACKLNCILCNCTPL